MEIGDSNFTPAHHTTAHTSSEVIPLKKNRVKKSLVFFIIVIVLALAILTPLAISKYKSFSKGTALSPSPSPSPMTKAPSTPSPTETPSVAKSEISVHILNGTGIPREAALLKSKLEEIGLEKFETGNADNENYTDTSVKFSSRISDALKNEIIQILEDTYSNIEEDGNPSSEYDLEIITGSRPGVSKPTDTPSPKPNITVSPTPSVSSSGTPTPSKTGTPTPTT